MCSDMFVNTVMLWVCDELEELICNYEHDLVLHGVVKNCLNSI